MPWDWNVFIWNGTDWGWWFRNFPVLTSRILRILFWAGKSAAGCCWLYYSEMTRAAMISRSLKFWRNSADITDNDDIVDIKSDDEDGDSNSHNWAVLGTSSCRLKLVFSSSWPLHVLVSETRDLLSTPSPSMLKNTNMNIINIKIIIINNSLKILD